MTEHMQCTICKLVKPLSDFTKDKSKPSGYHPWCRVCRKAVYDKDGHGREIHKRSYWKHPEKYRAAQKLYRLNHPEKTKEYRHKSYFKHLARNHEMRANRRKKYTADALAAYGGNPPRCACCGETNPLFLTLDHIDGCTQSERKVERSGWMLCMRLEKLGYPSGYQVLCFNCNLGRERNGGICPHKG